VSVASAQFLVAALLFAAGFFRLPAGNWRRHLFVVALVAFLCFSLSGLPGLAGLTVFILSGYGVARWLAKSPNPMVFGGYVVLMIAAFLVLKKYDAVRYIVPAAWLDHPIAVAGLSYILFRQIHFLTDVLQGQVARFTLMGYVSYQLNPLTLLSGPIQRFQDFEKFWADPQPLLGDLHQLLCAFQRIMIGTIKVAFIGAVCLGQFESATNEITRAMLGEFPITRWFALSRFAEVLYLYPAYVYFNFSGYCDIVIGTGALIGMKIPENFDRPYVSRNMIDFWTRQHMSLSFWIRDYLFTPLYKAIAERLPRQAPSLVFVCYFVAFFLAGVWHGSSMNFVAFGLLHGLGVSATKIWERLLIRRYGRTGLRSYMESRQLRIVAVFVTLHFVCFSFLFFTPDLERTIGMLGMAARAVLFKQI